MPLPRSSACPLSRTRLKPIVQIVTVSPSTLLVKFVGALLNLLLKRDQDGRPTSVRVLLAFSRSCLDGDLPFFPVVQSAVLICRLWCVSLPYSQLDTNPMPKRGSTLHHYQRQAGRSSLPRSCGSGWESWGTSSHGDLFLAVFKRAKRRRSACAGRLRKGSWGSWHAPRARCPPPASPGN